MWFVAFCYLTDAWRKTEPQTVTYGINNMRAAIAFSFFSIFPWVSEVILFAILILDGWIGTVFELRYCGFCLRKRRPIENIRCILFLVAAMYIFHVTTEEPMLSWTKLALALRPLWKWPTFSYLKLSEMFKDLL